MALDLLSNLKDFEKLLKICRRQGVTEIAFGEVSLKLGELSSKNQAEESEEIPTDELSPDQMIFYATNGAT